jgi:putative membrane protein
MKTVVTAVAFGLFAGGAMAQEMSAQDFVNEAASGGLFEVQSSQIAIEQAERDDVRSFAQQMVADHTAANNELVTVASDLGLTVPEEIAGTPAELMAAVQDAEGDTFDATYMEAQVAAHEATVELFRSYAENGDEERLVQFAETTLPALESHLEMAQGIAGE